jgi:segregation and condensation protein B
MASDPEPLRRIVEGALLAAGRPLDIAQLQGLFDPLEQPDAVQLRAALDAIAADCAGRAWELRRTASGYRLQVRAELAPWISRLWEEKPRRYSRSLLETLALIAYRQPVTRGDIEAVRGVAVSSDTIKLLLEREWVRVVGHRDVPGKPALYATTRQFLDYFNLESLDQLPPLGELRDLEFSEGLELAPAAQPSAEQPSVAQAEAEAEPAATMSAERAES